MAQTLYVIRHDKSGLGGFLCPPGHPFHEYTVEGYYGGKVKPVNGPDLLAALDYLTRNGYDDVPGHLRARAQRIMDEATLVYSSTWVRAVYGYFRDSYSPDGTDRNVSNAVIYRPRCLRCGLAPHPGKPGEEGHASLATRPPAEHHLGYLYVRQYFPGHRPRPWLIENPGRGYGAWPCDKCGQHVQYEARNDAWCVVSTSPGRWNPDCPQGGRHQVHRQAPPELFRLTGK